MKIDHLKQQFTAELKMKGCTDIKFANGIGYFIVEFEYKKCCYFMKVSGTKTGRIIKFIGEVTEITSTKLPFVQDVLEHALKKAYAGKINFRQKGEDDDKQAL